jgi:hypothetical protein
VKINPKRLGEEKPHGKGGSNNLGGFKHKGRINPRKLVSQ